MPLLKQRPSFWYIAMGCALTSFVSYGVGNFFPSFLMRSHGMSIGQVGVVLALVSGLTGAVGTYLGGYLGDHFGARDARWYLWVPMIGLGLGPFLTGLMSDLLAPQYGDDSLRYAMVISSMPALVAIGLFYIGARKLPTDLAKRQSEVEASLTR